MTLKKNAYIIADNIISPLGFTSEENFDKLKSMQTGVKRWETSSLSSEPVCAAVIEPKQLSAEFSKLKLDKAFTRLEQLIILSISDTLKQNPSIDIKSPKTLIILSTTKGNIDLLSKEEKGKFDRNRLFLWETGNVIASHFNNPNKTIIVSNACISGVLAIILGKRLLEEDTYDTIIVSGADLMTHFVVSGFQSFKAVSNEVCKPYDASRDGISLGEACATVVLTNNEKLISGSEKILVKSGSSSNDANHISGPSRTGDGLILAIEKTLQEAELKPSDIDYISGHGTATLYNDEMESQAITGTGLQNVPMNSLKSYFGHTLGAAGIVESIIGIHSMKNNTLIGTYNHNEPGVTKPLNIIKETQTAEVNNCLKTAAGFGGCNAAVLFIKE
jgi:3-oxoacyl-[acyl-carrier-protein] synthase-1